MTSKVFSDFLAAPSQLHQFLYYTQQACSVLLYRKLTLRNAIEILRYKMEIYIVFFGKFKKPVHKSSTVKISHHFNQY